MGELIGELTTKPPHDQTAVLVQYVWPVVLIDDKTNRSDAAQSTDQILSIMTSFGNAAFIELLSCSWMDYSHMVLTWSTIYGP
jgi:hypothetical protein